MPPLRRTPNAKAIFHPDLDEDQGFNPAWARAPDPIQYSRAPLQDSLSAGFQTNQSPAINTPEPLSGNAVAPSTISHNPPNNSPTGDDDTGLDLVTYAAMAPFAAAWYLINGASNVVQKSVTGTMALASAIRGAPKPARFDPLSRNKRPTRGTKSSRSSMLELPPYMVGATPNVVRQARGERKRGNVGIHTPTVAEARKWQLFHATPLPKPPKANCSTPVRSSAPPNTAPNTPFVTPKFEFNTPQRKIKFGKAKEFAHNVHKGDINTWLKLLHKHGIRTSALRTNWAKQFQFPTDGILSMARSSKDLSILAKAFCHEGFLTHCRLQLPSAVNPEPTIFRKNQPNINLSSVAQQRDGCCRFCRGFSWAGQHEVRHVYDDGSIPVRSHHKSVTPYTTEEKAQFDHNKFDMLFRRWCQESRYDWIFEEPHLEKDSHGQFTWRIPGDDPRLRHIAMMKQQHTNAVQAKKMYNADLTQERNTLIEDLSRQDIASKLLLDAIHEENPEMAKKYKELDLERKRRQVHTEWLCVKQVKLVLPTTSSTDRSEIRERRKRESSIDGSGAVTAKRARVTGRSVRWAPNLETNAPSDKSAACRKTPARGILKPAGAGITNKHSSSLHAEFAEPPGAETAQGHQASSRHFQQTMPSNDSTMQKKANLFTIIPGFDPVRIREYDQKGYADPQWDHGSNSSDAEKGTESKANLGRRRFHYNPLGSSLGSTIQQGNSFSLDPSSSEPSSSSSLSENTKKHETNKVPSRDVIPCQSGEHNEVPLGSSSILPDTEHLNDFLSVSKSVYEARSLQLDSITTFIGDYLRPWVAQPSPKCPDPVRNLYQKVTDLSLSNLSSGPAA